MTPKDKKEGRVDFLIPFRVGLWVFTLTVPQLEPQKLQSTTLPPTGVNGKHEAWFSTNPAPHK